MCENMERRGYDKSFDIAKIFDVVLAFGSETDYEVLLSTILTKMMEITHSDAGSLYIIEDGMLYFRIVKNKTLGIHKQGDEIDLPPISLDRDNVTNISAYTAINNEIVIIDDVYESQRFNFAGPKRYDQMTGYRTCSMLTLPLVFVKAGGPEVLGVIQLLNATDPATGLTVPYGDIHNPPVIPALANVAAQTLSNSMHMNEIRQLLYSFITVLTNTMDERSSHSSNHTQNVTRICGEFAQFLNQRFDRDHPFYFNEINLEQLKIAAMLHDIGKIVTPLEIMDKMDRLGSRMSCVAYRFEIKALQTEIDFLRGKLTKEEHDAEIQFVDEAFEFIKDVNIVSFLTAEKLKEMEKYSEITYRNEFGETVTLLNETDMEALSIVQGTLTGTERAIMQEHVVLTGRLLDTVDFWKYYKDVPDWARNHHEFLDGSGYPRGLQENELAVGSLVITIADIFDALTAADRPYRKAMPKTLAFGVLRGMAGDGKLHSELVELFIESRGGYEG